MAITGTFRAVTIGCMLLFGTCTVVIQKIIFNLSGKGQHGKVHTFAKPWFQTEVMFIGMFGCLAVYEGTNLYKHFRRGPEYQPLNSQKEQGPRPSRAKQYLLVIAPAMCDLVATAAMNIGLLWIPASVWQMLRGSMVVFSALFSKFFLKRKLYASHWVGVCMVVFALIVVAFSSLMPACNDVPESDDTASSQKVNANTSQQIIGVVLVVFAQIIQASQIVVEEHLLKEVDLPATLIVGLEGMWGGIVCSLLLIVITWIPTPYGENTLDTLIMLGKNPTILGTAILYACAILGYNMFGMMVTQGTSAVVRTILEGMRTACIWVTNLFIHYVVVPHNKKMGEHWTEWSYLQLCGFLFLLGGMLVYNKIVRIQGFYYEPDAAPAKAPEPKTSDDTPGQPQKEYSSPFIYSSPPFHQK